MGFFKNRGDKIVESGKKMVNYEQARSTWKIIADLASGLNPRNIKKGRVETFQSAYERLGLNETTLGKVYTNYFLKLYVSAIILAGGTALTVMYVINGSGAAVFTYVGFACVCLSQMFSASFRMYQMRLRQLCDITQWIKRPGEWFPTQVSLPPPPSSKSKTAIVKRP